MDGARNVMLGDLLVIGTPPAKLWKALAVIAEGLHPGFEADPRIKPGISKNSCVLTSLTVRDFLRGIGFVNARVAPVSTIMWATERGKELHSLGIGDPEDARDIDGHWTGHMVVLVSGHLIDTTLYHTRRPAWPDLPGMIAVPLAPKEKERRQWKGLDILTGTEITDPERDYIFSVGWFDNPRNTRWRGGGDTERERRKPVVTKLIERFGGWKGKRAVK